MPCGKRWEPLGRALGRDSGVVAPASGPRTALLGDHIKSHCLSAAGKRASIRGTPGDGSGWGTLASPITPHMDAELPPTHLMGGDACAKSERLTKEPDPVQHVQPAWERCISNGDAGPFPGCVAVSPPCLKLSYLNSYCLQF